MEWDNSRVLSMDTETSGVLPEYALQPWRVRQGKAWLTSLATVRRADDGFAIGGGLMTPYERPDDEAIRQRIALFFEEAHDLHAYVTGWNTVFDISWMLAYGFEREVMRTRWVDGMLLWRHWFIEPEYDMSRANKKSYGLKECVAEVLPQFAGYERDIDFHDPDPAVRAALHEYNVKDTMFTLRLTKHWWTKLQEQPERLRAALLEAECLPLVAQANLSGLVVDTIAARDLREKLNATAAAKLKSLAPHGVTEKIVRSPIQLATLLFDTWGLPVLKENTGKKTGKVSRSTDKETLHELSFEDPRAQELREYREALNNRTKFVETPLESVAYNEDGRTHPGAIVFGTYSGRMTYASKQGKNKDERQTGFALHQINREKEFRALMVAPPGYTIVEFDAAGQEFRWMAIASGDRTMLQLCQPGEDPHSFMTSKILGCDYRNLIELVSNGDEKADQDRKLGKFSNLSLQYRTSARKARSVARVQYGIPMTMPTAELIWKTYRQTYLDVPAYWTNEIAAVRRQGYQTTLGGRRVQVVGDWGGNFGWSMGSTAINYKIQGTGADQKYLALAVIKNYLPRVSGYFGWDFHDGIFFLIPDKYVVKVLDEVKLLLDNLPYKKAWGFTPPIPMPWDAKAGKSWGTLVGADKYKKSL